MNYYILSKAVFNTKVNKKLQLHEIINRMRSAYLITILSNHLRALKKDSEITLFVKFV
jgi:hypothetical protein